jgi:hypothetical protein
LAAFVGRRNRLRILELGQIDFRRGWNYKRMRQRDGAPAAPLTFENQPR